MNQGLTNKEVKTFRELIIKANDEQINGLFLLLNAEKIKREDLRG